MLELDVGELFRMHLPHHLAPQPARLQHVGLVHAGHSRPRSPEGHAGDPLDLGACVDAGVRGGVWGPRLLPEVDTAGQLAHHQQVGPFDQLPLERTRVIQRLQRLDRAQVGEQPQALAQPEQTLLGPGLIRVGGVPLRPAYSGQQAASGLEHRRGGVDVGHGVDPAGEQVDRDEHRSQEQDDEHRHLDQRAGLFGAQEERHAAGPQGGHHVHDQAQPDQADEVDPAAADVHPGDQRRDGHDASRDQPPGQGTQCVSGDDPAAAGRCQQQPAGKA